MSRAFRGPYSVSQLQSYFSHIHLPSSLLNISLVAGKAAEPNLDLLTRLQRQQLIHVPWENLSKHYSKYTAPVTALLAPQDVYSKVVGSAVKGSRGGRGGGCLENNVLLGSVMKSLGYNVYPGGGRVLVGGEWEGW